MAVSGLRLLFMFLKRGEQGEKADRKVPWYSYIALLGAGVVHGLFSSGGPLAIIYTTAAIKEKNQFRATLCLLWTTLNIVLIATYLIDGSITAEIGKTILWLLPFMLAGIVLGEVVAKRVNDRIFTILVYICLLLTGIFMLI